ncbi:hypothetical protein PHBOTO_005969 [Pseudozyma hubeiensis]|nr:hypothetical protein PHBOTO_005969 [Pseudozyma hubeiensis]
MSYPHQRSARGSSDLNTRYQRISSHQQQQQQQQQQRQRQLPQRTYSATTPTWTSQPVPEPPLLPPLVDLANWIASLPPIQQWPQLLVDRLLLAPVTQLLQYTRDIILSPKTHRIVVRLGVLATIFWIALAAAIVSYVGFYRAWVPDVGLRKEIWLQYGQDRPPYAHLDFGHGAQGYRLREPTPSSSSYNAADVSGEFFATDQAYDVTLELSVPLNQANLDLGNFMVDLELKSRSNISVFHVSKPTLLTYSTAPVRAADSISQMISRNPASTQAPSNSQLLRISLLRRAVLRPSSFAPGLSSAGDGRSDRKVTHGQVSVGRADSDKYWMYGGNHNTLAGIQALPGTGRMVPLAVGSHSSRGELQTYAASIRFDAHLTGLRFFMYHFPVLSFLLFTGLFLACEMATALTLWAVAAIWTSGMSLEADVHYQQGEGKWRGEGGEGRMRSDDGVKMEESASGDEGYGRMEEEEDETETEGGYLGRRVKEEEYSDEEEGEEEKARLRSMQSLREADEADLQEAIRQSRMRDLLEARRMSGAGPSREPAGGGGEASLMEFVDPTAPISPEELSEIQLSRRVLDRLDEETEEETDVASSRPSSRMAARGGGVREGGETDAWEDLEDESTSGGEGVEVRGESGREGNKESSGDDDDGGDTTIGGSATSGGRTMRSFGATTTAAGSSSTRTD